MVFIEILTELIESVDGAIGASIMGVDGFSIEKHTTGNGDCDIDLVGIEFGKVVTEVGSISNILDLGGVDEVSISAGKRYVLMRRVSPEYFIVFVLEKEANPGKARFSLKRAAEKALDELGE